MADSNGPTSTDPTTEPTSKIPVSSKGKGKAAVDETPMADASMGEEDDSSDESGAEEHVCIYSLSSEVAWTSTNVNLTSGCGRYAVPLTRPPVPHVISCHHLTNRI